MTITRSLLFLIAACCLTAGMALAASPAIPWDSLTPQEQQALKSFARRWEKLPPEWGWYVDPSLPFHPEHGVPAILPTIDLNKAGVEDIDGRPYYHLNTTTQGEYIT